MKLGFHYHIPLEEINGQFLTPAYFGFFIDSIAPHFEELVCFMHSKGSMSVSLDYSIKSSNVRLIDLGPYDRIMKRKIAFCSVQKEVKSEIDKLEAVLMRASTPLLKNFYQLAGSKVTLMLVSNAVDGLDELPQPKWRLTLIKYWAKRYQHFEDELSKSALTLVNSDKLLEAHKGISKRLYRIRTTTLSERDFWSRKELFQNSVVRLLFTGRVASNKGIQDIISCLLSLNEDVEVIRQFHLDVVGPYSENDPFYQDLVKQIEDVGLSEGVTFHGYMTAGPKLLQFYRNADIFIMASRSSAEGFPRVLWEAMASSLPIVSSNVAGIAEALAGRAHFFQPGNVEEMKESILGKLENQDLCKNQIASATKFASSNTLEATGLEIATIIKSEMHNDG